MGTVKMKRLDVERYGRALNSLLEAVSGGLPPPEQLGRLLDGEERARCALPLMSEEALLDLTFDFDVELEDFFEPAAELRRAGRRMEADRVLVIADFLYPELKGLPSLAAHGLGGDIDLAVRGLRDAALNPSRSDLCRMYALNLLEGLGATEEWVRASAELILRYLSAKDLSNARAVGSMLDIGLCVLEEQGRPDWPRCDVPMRGS